MTKVHHSNIEAEAASGGGGSVPYPDAEMRSKGHTSNRIAVVSETESRSSPPLQSAAGPSASANTEAPITLAPRGSVFRYFGFGADDGSFDLLPSVQLQSIDSTFESSVHRNPYTVADMPVASKPNSDDLPHPVTGFLNSSVASKPNRDSDDHPPSLLASSFTSNSSSTVDPRCSSPNLFSVVCEEVPVTPPANAEFPLHPPTLKARRGPVFAYFGDLEYDILNPPVLSLNEDSFHTPNPRS